MKLYALLSLLQVLFISTIAQSQDTSDFLNALSIIKSKPGYEAKIPIEICKQIFPINKILNQNIDIPENSPSFQIFTFTISEFQPSKPSILILSGGPGGMWSSIESDQISKLFQNHNVIFFHPRGGGCSSFPSADTTLDEFISSNKVIDDIEVIRKAYSIQTWSSVIGFSYGTHIARCYANKFPDRTKLLVLEGLSSDTKLPEEMETERVFEVINNRLKLADSFKNLGSEVIKVFNEGLRSYFSQIPLQKSFEYVSLWTFYEKFYSNHFKSVGQRMPKYLSRSTFLALTLLMYSGDSSSADYAIIMLLNNLEIYSLPPTELAQIQKGLELFDRTLFPFYYDDYLNTFKSSQLLSWRVLLNMPENDKKLDDSNLCSKVDTIIINGAQDLATPVENVSAYLGNKSCAAGNNKALIIKGGGHSILTNMICLSDFVKNEMNGITRTEILQTCDLTVTMSVYLK